MHELATSPSSPSAESCGEGAASQRWPGSCGFSTLLGSQSFLSSSPQLPAPHTPRRRHRRGGSGSLSSKGDSSPASSKVLLDLPVKPVLISYSCPLVSPSLLVSAARHPLRSPPPPHTHTCVCKARAAVALPVFEALSKCLLSECGVDEINQIHLSYSSLSEMIRF